MKEKINEAGILYDLDLDKTRVYNIFTKAGNYRGGKVYSNEKYFIILNGKCLLITKDLETGENIKKEFIRGKLGKIEARVPNIFYFEEDSEMLEWFDKDTTKEDFEEFRNMKNNI